MMVEEDEGEMEELLEKELEVEEVGERRDQVEEEEKEQEEKKVVSLVVRGLQLGAGSKPHSQHYAVWPPHTLRFPPVVLSPIRPAFRP